MPQTRIGVLIGGVEKDLATAGPWAGRRPPRGAAREPEAADGLRHCR